MNSAQAGMAAAMQAVDAMEAHEELKARQVSYRNVVPGPGHNNPPEEMKQDVVQDKIQLAKQIHTKNLNMPTAELESDIAKMEANNQKLIQRIAVYQSSGEAELKTAENEYEIYRGLLEAEMADAVKRRDAFIDTLNEEIAGIRLRLTTAESDHEMKKGQIIRHNQDQIAAMKEAIKRNKKWLEG